MNTSGHRTANGLQWLIVNCVMLHAFTAYYHYLENLDLKTDCTAPPISDVSDNKRFLHSMIIVLLLTHDFITIILMTWTAGSSLLNFRIEQSDWRRWNWMLTWLGLISIDDQWQSGVLISGIYILFHPSPSREPPWVLLFWPVLRCEMTMVHLMTSVSSVQVSVMTMHLSPTNIVIHISIQ